jgi:hypothetical protein
MTVFDDAPYEARIALCDPAQREEGGPRVMLVEKLEDDLDVTLDPTGIAVPLATVEVGLKGLDLEVIFHVNSHGVD